MTLPRFDYEGHLAALTGDDPRWPAIDPRGVGTAPVVPRARRSGLLAGLPGRAPCISISSTIPANGCWTWRCWTRPMPTGPKPPSTRIAKRPEAADFMATARAEDGALPLDEPRAQALAAAFTAYLAAARAAGWSDCTPGRFLLPGDLAGSPVLTFAPLPKPASTPRDSLWREMERRFEAYKARVVQPVLSRPFRPDRPAGGAGRCAGRHPCRARRRWRICAAPWPMCWRPSAPAATAG